MCAWGGRSDKVAQDKTTLMMLQNVVRRARTLFVSMPSLALSFTLSSLSVTTPSRSCAIKIQKFGSKQMLQPKLFTSGRPHARLATLSLYLHLNKCPEWKCCGNIGLFFSPTIVFLIRNQVNLQSGLHNYYNLQPVIPFKLEPTSWSKPLNWGCILTHMLCPSTWSSREAKSIGDQSSETSRWVTSEIHFPLHPTMTDPDFS